MIFGGIVKFMINVFFSLVFNIIIFWKFNRVIDFVDCVLWDCILKKIVWSNGNIV